MAQTTHDNHFVPQLYLKQWSEDGSHIWAYRLLVSHENVPPWKLSPIRGIAVHRDLYTSYANSEAVDEYERWLEAEIESPAKEVFHKVVNNKRLISSDWEKLIWFLAAQDVRTPTGYMEFVERTEKLVPKILDEKLKEAVKLMEQKRLRAHPRRNSNAPRILFKSDRTLRVKTLPSDEPGKSIIKAEVTIGRELWLEEQQFLLANTAKALFAHKWGIASPASGMEWFTSDHPVVKLNFYRGGRFDLKGGWGSQGTDLLMPLSPYHLLFAEIGRDIPDQFTFGHLGTVLIQKYIAERAMRWIFARRQMRNAELFRPRYVDATAFVAEQEQYQKWIEEQDGAERPDSDSGKTYMR